LLVTSTPPLSHRNSFPTRRSSDLAAKSGNRMRFGNNMLDATYGLDASDSLAVLCNGKGNFSSGLGQLPNNCLLATLGERLEEPDTKITAGAAFSRNGNRVGALAGSGRDTLPA